MSPQTIIALSLLSIGISAIAVIRVNRGEQIGDEFTDADCRTEALADGVHGDVITLPDAAKGGGRARRSAGQAQGMVSFHSEGADR